MIISRYIVREILRPLLVIIGVLSVVFLSYSAALVLNDVAAGLMPAGTIAKYILIRLIIALEVLLPIALYLSVVVGLGRLHSDSEMTALAASGIGELSVVGTVFRLSVVVAVMVAGFSLVVRPWAYQQRYLLRAVAQAQFNLADLEGARFYVSPESDYAVYTDAVDQHDRRARGVLFQVRKDDQLMVIAADALHQPVRSVTEPVSLVFSAGHAYQLDRDGSRDILMKFGQLTLHLALAEPKDVGYKSKSQGTIALSRSHRPKDIAEFQWRLSTPLATVLMAMLAIPLSRAPPRRGRYGKTVAALLVYAVLHNLMALAKNLVQEGLVGAVPGLWWPLALLALALLAMVVWPRRWRGSQPS